MVEPLASMPEAQGERERITEHLASMPEAQEKKERKRERGKGKETHKVNLNRTVTAVG